MSICLLAGSCTDHLQEGVLKLSCTFSRYGEEEILEKLETKRRELLAAISEEATKDR